MTLELWNTFATFGTFIVIAATAIAALVQLRHARTSNQIAALAPLQDFFQTPQYLDAAHSVNTELAAKLKDPEFRYQVGNRHARTRENEILIARANSIGNFFGNLGLLVKTGIISRDLAVSIWWNHAIGRWDDLRLFTAIVRHTQGEVWTDFEYFVVLSQDYHAEHPGGSYPVGVRRLALDYEFLEADRQYAASRAAA